MDEIRPIDANALIDALRVMGANGLTLHGGQYAYCQALKIIQDAPTIKKLLPQWRKAEETPPTRKDANGNGCVLAVHKREGYVGEWQFYTVADAPEDFYCWYPLQEPPEEFFK